MTRHHRIGFSHAQKRSVDAQTIQLFGNILKAAEKPKDAEKYYKIRLKKFPNVTHLYGEYGELLLPTP